jgi:hypothetical protein
LFRWRELFPWLIFSLALAFPLALAFAMILALAFAFEGGAGPTAPEKAVSAPASTSSGISSKTVSAPIC